VAALRRHTDAEWVEALNQRYLDFNRIDRLLAQAATKRGQRP